VSAVCSNILMFLVAMAPAEGLHSVIWWMLGNLEPASPRLLAVSSVVIIAGLAAIWALAPELNSLTLGRETAHNLGVRTHLFVVLGLVLATLITAAAVGMAGLIGFVGLIVPHVMRNLVGPDHRRLIPAAAIGGRAVRMGLGGAGSSWAGGASGYFFSVRQPAHRQMSATDRVAGRWRWSAGMMRFLSPCADARAGFSARRDTSRSCAARRSCPCP